MNSFFQESLFAGLALSLVAYVIGMALKKKLKIGIFHPLLISISPFLVLQRLRSIVAVSTARAFLRNAVISGSGLGGASYHWGLLIGSSVSSLCAGMKDVPISFGKLRGGLNEITGVRMGSKHY